MNTTDKVLSAPNDAEMSVAGVIEALQGVFDSQALPGCQPDPQDEALIELVAALAAWTTAWTQARQCEHALAQAGHDPEMPPCRETAGRDAALALTFDRWQRVDETLKNPNLNWVEVTS